MSEFFYLIPIILANTAPILAAIIYPLWNVPVDFGIRLGNERLFGITKTWRGVLSAMIMGVGCALVLNLTIYPMTTPVLHGIIFGLIPMVGDLLTSFFKRRIHIASTEYHWLDNLDIPIGVSIFFWMFTFRFILVTWIIIPVIHQGANIIFERLKSIN